MNDIFKIHKRFLSNNFKKNYPHVDVVIIELDNWTTDWISKKLDEVNFIRENPCGLQSST